MDNAGGARMFNFGGFRRMLVRPETPEEFPEIRRLVKSAFETARVANGREQDFVDQLRASAAYIPELALAAEENGNLVGHLMLTRMDFEADDGKAVRLLLLGPLSVPLEYRNRKVGTNLVREGLRRAMALGFDAVILVGDPGYYHRLGFAAAAEFGVRHDGAVPGRFVQAIELRPGGLPAGRVMLEGM